MENLSLMVFGFIGQALFGTRFLVQWICSEIKKKSYIPTVFWYFSLVGGSVLLVYAILRKDPVFIVGQSMGLIVYSRNLILVYRHKRNNQQLIA